MNKKVVLKKWVRVVLLIIILAVFVFSFMLIRSSFEILPNSFDYSYSVKPSVDYKVYLYDNSFFDVEYWEKNDTYTSDVIKKISMDFEYKYSGSKIIPLNYSYDIKGYIDANYQSTETGNSSVLHKEYSLLETKKGVLNDINNLTIKESYDIDYNYYDGIVSDFRKTYKYPITAMFNVVMTVNVYSDEIKVDDTKTITVSIPLNQQVFKIVEPELEKINNNILNANDVKERINRPKLIVGVLIGIIDAVLFGISFDKLICIKKKTKYEIKLNKIFKQYGDIIIEVVNLMDSEDMCLIYVKSFNEMVDLEDELRIPIMYYETKERLEGEFTLIYNNIMYKYILDND